MLYERAYAKINLALGVGQEKDGYHEVENMMVPISLYDELFFEKNSKDMIDCSEDIEDNICFKAITLFKEHFNIKECVSIVLKKNIPLAAGLAGGSSDAAATLKGLNRLFGVNASLKELDGLARMLGSDVPFFIYHQPALCTGRGEVVTPLLIDFKDVPLLLIKPKYGLSTKEIYSHYEYVENSYDKTLKEIYKAMEEKELDVLDKLIFNDLEKVAFNLNSDLDDLFKRIASLSYIPHLSGSGPTIYLLNATSMDLENIREIDESLDLFLVHTI